MKKLFPFPNGWYVIADASELLHETLVNKRFAGKDLVLYRTKSGVVVASDAHCPHMGAHLGIGGKIIGEEIQCPFHFFCFDPEGNCTKTGYNTTPPKVKLKNYIVKEVNSFILIWFDLKSNPPEWEVPSISFDDWSEIKTKDFEINSHPQETTENSVDIGHFGVVHQYTNINQIEPLKTSGAYLNAKYGFNRAPEGFIGKGKDGIRATINIHVYGLGYSFVEVDLPELGMQTRQYVFPRPIDDGRIILKIGMQVKKIEQPKKIHPLLAFVPTGFLNSLILKKAFQGYVNDVSQDFDVWQNKVYIDPPVLAAGDGPIVLYRKWAAQFYYN